MFSLSLFIPFLSFVITILKEFLYSFRMKLYILMRNHSFSACSSTFLRSPSLFFFKLFFYISLTRVFISFLFSPFMLFLLNHPYSILYRFLLYTLLNHSLSTILPQFLFFSVFFFLFFLFIIGSISLNIFHKILFLKR